jgi:hypothetical protein
MNMQLLPLVQGVVLATDVTVIAINLTASSCIGTKYAKQSPSQEANTSSAIQEIPSVYRTKMFIIMHTKPANFLYPMEDESGPDPPPKKNYFLKIDFKIILLFMSGCPRGIFQSGFLIKTLCVFFCMPVSATRLAHHIIFDFYHSNNIS